MTRPMSNTLTPDDLVTLNRAATIARLLSGVAHDVNNALQVIGGSVELLEDLSLPPVAVTRIGRIRSQHERAATVVHNLLAFARERTEGTTRINVNEMVTRTISLRAFAISRAGIAITVDAPPGRALSTQGNPMELQQALLNLLANAEQALAGVAGAAIAVQLTEEDGSVLIRVSDNGPGVPAELRAEVFEPFFTTRSRSDASGLGLAVARAIAERSGGKLDLEESASGASFVMRLPKI